MQVNSGGELGWSRRLKGAIKGDKSDEVARLQIAEGVESWAKKLGSFSSI